MGKCIVDKMPDILRLLIYELAYFLIPAIVCLTCYVKVVSTLKTSQSMSKKAKQLTLIFFVSWLVWVILWSPLFVVNVYRAIFDVGGISIITGMKYDFLINRIFVDADLIRCSFSAVNPFVFLLAAKPFQEKLVKWFCVTK